MIRLALISMILLGLSAPLPATAQDSTLWRRVAQADLIVVGRIEGPSVVPERAYVELPLRDARPLKGEVGETIRWYSEPQLHAPSLEQLRAASGVDSLVFAQRSEGSLYFAGDTPDSLRPADGQAVAAVQAEIARQARVIADWRTDPTVPHYAEVHAIIEEIAALRSSSRDQRRTGATEQQRLFDRLITFGPEAVPAIIMQMDDDRPLAHSQISLVNDSPAAFEGLRHYGPDVLTEALAAVLNQITGEHFGFIYNGAGEAERRHVVTAWRVYLDHLESNPGA